MSYPAKPKTKKPVEPPPPRSLWCFQVALRPDVVALVSVPRDLTADEAKRLTRLIESLPEVENE